MKYDSSKDYVDSLKRDIDKLAETIENAEAKSLAQDINQATDNDVEATANKNEVNVRENRSQGRQVIDLKKGFRTGSSVKHPKKGGGWYTIVPIRRYTNQPGTKGMNNRMYEQLRKRKTNSDSATIISDYMYDRRIPNNPDSLIQYIPSSNNVTKIKNKKRRGSRYIVFRTVSDKSDPASWILNRADATDDSDDEVRRIVDEIVRFRGY